MDKNKAEIKEENINNMFILLEEAFAEPPVDDRDGWETGEAFPTQEELDNE